MEYALERIKERLSTIENINKMSSLEIDKYVSELFEPKQITLPKDMIMELGKYCIPSDYEELKKRPEFSMSIRHMEIDNDLDIYELALINVYSEIIGIFSSNVEIKTKYNWYIVLHKHYGIIINGACNNIILHNTPDENMKYENAHYTSNTEIPIRFFKDGIKFAIEFFNKHKNVDVKEFIKQIDDPVFNFENYCE